MKKKWEFAGICFCMLLWLPSAIASASQSDSFNQTEPIKTQSDWSRNMSLFLGVVSYLNNDSPMSSDNGLEGGFEFDIGEKGSSLHAVTSLSYSSTSSQDKTTKSTEFDSGIRKIFGRSRFHPFLEGGVAAYYRYFDHVATMSGDVITDSSESKVSPWIGAGGYLMLGGHFNIGLSFSISSLGAHYGILTGYSW